MDKEAFYPSRSMTVRHFKGPLGFLDFKTLRVLDSAPISIAMKKCYGIHVILVTLNPNPLLFLLPLLDILFILEN